MDERKGDDGRGGRMAARFALSLDCEGKWGMADQLTPGLHTALADAPLRAAYIGLLDALDRYDIPATFAFVGAFSLNRAALVDLRPALDELARHFPDYLGPASAGIAEGAEGWCGEWAVDAVATARIRHEIALHGATHLPWDHPALTPELARRELGLVYEAAAPILRHVSTYVFPRNAVAHLDVLDEFGIAGARAARLRSSRAANLLAEFDLRAPSDPDPAPAVPLEVPAGYFVNWRSGARRVVPPPLTRLRVRRMLAHAERTGGVVHLWTHPENLATAPPTLDLLRGILADVARMRDAGRCEVLTQDQYCRSVDPAHVERAAARRDALLVRR
jgi:peptidoglycan/xylan/chitin deacetylase (PgdA/CDA1 family)